MSKFTKYNKKSKNLKEGLVITSEEGINFKLSQVFEKESEKRVIISTHEIEMILPVRDVVENIRKGRWKIVKDGPIEPEKILKQFKFI